MKNRLLFITIMLLFAAVSVQTVTLNFAGCDASNRYVSLNRVVVSNLTRSWQETLMWPNSMLVMTDQTGIEDVETQDFVCAEKPEPSRLAFRHSKSSDAKLSRLTPGVVGVTVRTHQR